MNINWNSLTSLIKDSNKIGKCNLLAEIIKLLEADIGKITLGANSNIQFISPSIRRK